MKRHEASLVSYLYSCLPGRTKHVCIPDECVSMASAHTHRRVVRRHVLALCRCRSPYVWQEAPLLSCSIWVQLRAPLSPLSCFPNRHDPDISSPIESAPGLISLLWLERSRVCNFLGTIYLRIVWRIFFFFLLWASHAASNDSPSSGLMQLLLNVQIKLLMHSQTYGDSWL